MIQDILIQLIAGFHSALTLWNLAFVALGVAIGILFGVLPGVGGVTALSIMVPVTFYMEPVTALGFLIGITKGGTSGGAIPAILLNAPGSSENVATARDGYPLAKGGKPVKAMRMALYSSVFGDACSDVVLIFLAAPFAAIAILFGPVEISAMVLLAFTLIAGLSGNSLTKGLLAAAFGMFLATIGLDPEDGSQRMTFGIISLYDGISLNALAIGLLAMSSILSQLVDEWRPHALLTPAVTTWQKTAQKIHWHEFRACLRTLFRSAYIGTFVGMMPGLGATLAGFLGYSAAKRASRTPEKFGTGHLEGIAATEAANSAVMGSNLIPTIALGIPGNVAAALLIGAFTIHGITPGPFMMATNGPVIYALFALMLMANLVHIFIGRTGIPIWVMALKVPKSVILPLVSVFCVIGTWLPSNSMVEVGLMFAFAILGFIMRKTGFSSVALFMGFLLTPILEHSLRQAMVLYDNDPTVYFTRPMALPFTLLTLFFVWQLGFRRWFRKDRSGNEQDRERA